MSMKRPPYEGSVKLGPGYFGSQRPYWRPSMDDHADAARYAQSAGAVLLALRDDDSRPPWALGDAGDDVANRHLLELLAADHPDDRILSEESADDRRRLDADRVWIIDPLDGTREYTEPGRNDWAVHVALWERGHGLTAGAVALPALGTVLSTGEPPGGARLEDRPLRVDRESVARARGRAARRRSTRRRSRVPRVGRREGDGGRARRTPTRTCTPAASTSGTPPRPRPSHSRPDCTRPALDGSPLEYNQSSPWLPDLVVCRPELADQVLKITTQ